MTGRVDDDWLEGTLQGQKGMFPASFIDRVPSGLSQVGMEEKEVPSVQQSAADSKPAKVGVTCVQEVWPSVQECVAQYTRGRGTVHKGV